MTALQKQSIAAWLFAGVAVALSLHTWLSTPEKLARLQRRAADLETVHHLSTRWDAEMAYQQSLKAAGQIRPPDLPEMAARALEGKPQPRIQFRPARPALEGWQVREAQVEWDHVPYSLLAIFLDYAGGFRPGWRLQEISFHPDAEGAQGAVSLVLEALEMETP